MPPMTPTASPWRTRYPSLAWVAPFAVFMLWLALAPSLALPQPWESLLRVSVLIATLWITSRDILRTLRVRHLLASTLLGVAVAALWVAPDQLVPGWRAHWLFQNRITGQITTSINPADLANPLVMGLRVLRAMILVPILEELFWRGFLPRWLINPDWEQVPAGRYTTFAFLATALLFAAEHGPFWEVGLLCGVIYNWWYWRTQSLGDIILVHAVTNAALSGFVVLTGQYAYWM